MTPVEHIHRIKRPPIVRKRSSRGVGDGACGPGAFQDPQEPWLTDGSGNPSSTPHCVMNTYSTKVYSQMGIPEDIASQLPPGFNPNAPAMPGAVSVAQWFADPTDTGGCPVIDPSKNLCASKNANGTLSSIGCNAYRECDSLVPAMAAAGANPFGTLTLPPHVEYGLPGGPTGNVGFGAPASGNVPAQTLYSDPTSALYAIGSPGQPVPRSGLPSNQVLAGSGSGAQLTAQQLAAAGKNSNTVPSKTINGQSSQQTTASQTNFFTDSTIIASVPNWVVLAGGATVVAFMLLRKK